MKTPKMIKALTTAALMATTVTAGAQSGTGTAYGDSILQPAADMASSVPAVKPDKRHWFRLHAMARPHGDSIVVRWAPDEYVPWKYLNGYGYQVERVHYDKEGMHVDTLATNLHPLPRREFMRRFAPTDSLAGAAVQLIFGRGTTLDQTEAAPGTMGSIQEVYDEQQNYFGFAMLVAEQRPDLAQAMGLMYVDRNARRGETYEYIVRPLVADSILPVHACTTGDVRNVPFKGVAYQTQLRDSLIGPRTLLLQWPYDSYTSFNIERRDNGGQWHQLNRKPYIAMETEQVGEGVQGNRYVDDMLLPGTYDYRISAYDAFGQLTAPCSPYTVTLDDNIPPSAPQLLRIDIERTDSTVMAVLHWQKESVEPDLRGFLPLYYNDKMMLTDWLPLSPQLLKPTTTSCRVNVTGLMSGTVCIAAYDESGNVAASLPMPISIADLTPPQPPTNLRATVAPTGQVYLRWTPSVDRDVMEYQVYYANDLSHTFGRVSNVGLRDTTFTDTISTEANQRFVYYRLQATDWSGNESLPTEPIAVPIPDFTPPPACRIDSMATTDHSIRTWWIASSAARAYRHRIYRKLEGDEHWTLLAVIEADSLKDHKFVVEDQPPYHQKQRYLYAVETLSQMGSSSGLSPIQATYFKGPQVFDIPLRLAATYDTRDKLTRLAWDKAVLPAEVDGADYYYCIYRKGPDDERYQFVTSVEKDALEYTDHLLREGQTAQYYLKIHFRDGRNSKPSKTVTVKR